MKPSMVTTALGLPGQKIIKNVGIVRGITVRSRSIVGNFLANIQSVFGGNISIYTNMCETARSQTYKMMCDQAEKNGGNAIIAMHYDATEIMPGVTEVICYGTAVLVKEDSSAE